jgi:hypothetical protein
MNLMGRQRSVTPSTTTHTSQQQENNTMAEQGSKTFSLSDGEVRLWIDEDGAICLKAVTSFNDPVELSSAEAMKLAQILKTLSEQISD